MKLAFPLSFKVSLWLLLNLLLLAIGGALFFFAQIGFGWESFISGPAGARVQAIGEVIAAELSQNPTRNRDEVLTRFSAVYSVELRLLLEDGTVLAGRPVDLPAEVRARLPMPRAGGEGFRPAGGPPFPPPEFVRSELPRPEGPRMGRFAARGRFFQRTTEPTRYWIGIHMPLPIGDGPRRRPVTLLAVTDSLWGSGLLFDFKPWLITAAAVAGFSILFWLPLVRGITRAVGQITRATERIAEGHFETRVHTGRRDELGRLGEAINVMAGRLDGFVQGQRRFLGDIAHELGSPLARLQFATGILEERADPALRSAVADVREEVQHMSTLVGELLAFTKAGLGPRESSLETIALAPLVARMLEREGAAARVAVAVAPTLQVRVDPELFARALGNLVRNALRYAGDASAIALTAEEGPQQIVIAVADDGPGVAPAALPHLGEPFYRPEAARTSESGGVGLGLAIVKNAVHACHGTVRFDNRTPHGFVAEIRLPVATARAGT
ncbi:MAG: HAMP domain-containing histidine kinase [Opitutae bacterium]|nr:HAMP domain-containing histidine kinase [Opitutae bacterium]